MADPIRIANCSGFFGDRLSGAREMVEDGPIDVLTGDWLAELTMLILARTRLKRPNGGFARTFVTQMEQVMGTCLDRGIKVVSNAGGLDPDGCAEAVAKVADELGLHPKIAYVRGDDLMPRLEELIASAQLSHFETGEPIKEASFLTANAYLGCWGIVDALEQGADIVITGRVTDAAVVCGPAAWHHGWSRTDWDALAGGVVAGHVIECSSQATGGNYSFFNEVPGMKRVGFPWAEVAADGSTVIGKHDGTGGEVSVGTITSQLLYEIGGPQYFGPDVTTRFDTIELEQVETDRVRIFNVKGEPPPSTLKVCLNRTGGFRNDMSVCLTGLDIEAKAALVEEAFWEACPFAPSDYAFVSTRLMRNDHPDPETNEQAVAILKISVKDPDEKKVGRGFANAMTELALATIPGFFGVGSGPAAGRPFGVYEPARIPAEIVPQQVVVLGDEAREISSVIPPAEVSVVPNPGPSAAAPSGPTRAAPLGALYGARSGDKGGNANLGIFARSDEAWAWLDEHLSVERLRALLPEVKDLTVDRHRLPAIRSLNFVIHGLLEEGVAASTRQDPQAKSLGEWLRARVVELPEALLFLSAAEPKTRARMRFPGVRAPKRLLAPDTERQLTARQRELLEDLEKLVASEELANLTMAEIAAQVNCSLRTLYGIAPSKEELVLMVVDRRLHRIGRTAIGSLDASLSPLAALRAYLRAANEAVQPETAAFARDFSALPGAKRMLDAHEDYVMAVTRSLLDRAVSEGEIEPVDTASFAHILGGLGRELSRPEVADAASAPPKETADAIAEVIFRGLETG